MRRVARVLGWIFVGLAALLLLFGLLTWPPGGLMFALPFVFLMPGALFGLVGGLLLLATRQPRSQDPPGPDSP